MKTKRFLSLLLALAMSLALSVPAFATETAHLYAYSSEDLTGQEEYASSKFGSFVYAHGSRDDSSTLMLGKGIKIDDPNDFEKVLFPVWSGSEVVATLLVTTVDEGVYSGSYSEIYAEQLSALKGIATQREPLALVVSTNGFYGVISDKWYDLNGNAGEYTVQESAQTVAEASVQGDDQIASAGIIDAAEFLPYREYQQPRIPTSYALPYTPYYDLKGIYDRWCYAAALGNVLCNMDGSKSRNYMAEILSYMHNLHTAGWLNLAQYLETIGRSCTFSNIGFMSFENVKSTIYYGKSYMVIGAQQLDNPGSRHMFVLFGYMDDGMNQYLSISNPWYTYTQTIDATTRIIPTELTSSYFWDDGYLYNIN